MTLHAILKNTFSDIFNASGRLIQSYYSCQLLILLFSYFTKRKLLQMI